MERQLPIALTRRCSCWVDPVVSYSFVLVFAHGLRAWYSSEHPKSLFKKTRVGWSKIPKKVSKVLTCFDLRHFSDPSDLHFISLSLKLCGPLPRL